MGRLKRIHQNVKNGEYCSAEKVIDIKQQLPTELGYDEETKIIYNCFGNSTLRVISASRHMYPYVNSNGKHCRFINNRIVEVS